MMKGKLLVERVVLALTLSVVALAGCTSQPSEPKRAEPAIDLANIPASGSLSFPLDAYEVNDEQARVNNQSFNLLMQRCLKRFGFDVPLTEPMGKMYYPLDKRFGLISQEDAAIYGYLGKPNPTRRSPFQSKVPAEAKPLLVGEGEATVAGQQVPEGGCQGEASRKLYEGAVEHVKDDVAERLQRDAMKFAREDSRVQKLIEAWRECVGKSGYQYKDPEDAVRYWHNKHEEPGTPAAQEEKDAAVVDVKCKHETGLLRTWQAAVLAYEQELIDENAERLAEFKRSTETLVRNAERIASAG